MSGIRLYNKAITAVDTSERIKLSLASKERDKKYVPLHAGDQSAGGNIYG